MWLSKFINKIVWPIKVIKYKSLNGIKSRKDFYKIIANERERSNRNNHQVSLVVFNLDSFPDNGKERKQLIRNINDEKRSIDDIGWLRRHSVGVTLPYTSSRGAREFSVRVCRTLNFIMPDSFCYLFTYPLERDSDDDSKNTDVDDAKTESDDNDKSTSVRSVSS